MFNLESKQNEITIQLSTIPDSLDWDEDETYGLPITTVLRKAREYSSGVYTSFQTSTVSSGFLSFEVLSDNNMIIGGFDSKLHLFDQYGNSVIADE